MILNCANGVFTLLFIQKTRSRGVIVYAKNAVGGHSIHEVHQNDRLLHSPAGPDPVVTRSISFHSSSQQIDLIDGHKRLVINGAFPHLVRLLDFYSSMI